MIRTVTTITNVIFQKGCLCLRFMEETRQRKCFGIPKVLTSDYYAEQAHDVHIDARDCNGNNAEEQTSSGK